MCVCGWVLRALFIPPILEYKQESSIALMWPVSFCYKTVFGGFWRASPCRAGEAQWLRSLGSRPVAGRTALGKSLKLPVSSCEDDYTLASCFFRHGDLWTPHACSSHCGISHHECLSHNALPLPNPAYAPYHPCDFHPSLPFSLLTLQHAGTEPALNQGRASPTLLGALPNPLSFLAPLHLLRSPSCILLWVVSCLSPLLC